MKNIFLYKNNPFLLQIKHTIFFYEIKPIFVANHKKYFLLQKKPIFNANQAYNFLLRNKTHFCSIKRINILYCQGRGAFRNKTDNDKTLLNKWNQNRDTVGRGGSSILI